MCKIKDPSIVASLTNLCYIINRLADNSNICKTIAIAITGAYITLTKDPTYGQFWFVFFLICILAFNDGLYMGLKINLQDISDVLSNGAVSNNASQIKNPFDLKELKELLAPNASEIKANAKINQGTKASTDTKSKKATSETWIKIKRDIKTSWKGFRTITTLPFYSVILFGLLLFQYWGVSWIFIKCVYSKLVNLF